MKDVEKFLPYRNSRMTLRIDLDLHTAEWRLAAWGRRDVGERIRPVIVRRSTDLKGICNFVQGYFGGVEKELGAIVCAKVGIDVQQLIKDVKREAKFEKEIGNL